MKNIVYCINILFFLFGAVSCSSDFLKKSPDTETLRLYIRASDAYARGQFTEVTEILFRQNTFPPALILRAKAEYFLGDLEKAEKSYRRAIRLRPSSLEASLYLARILYENGNLSGAHAVTETLLTDNPHDIRALRLAADIAFETGKIDEALILLNRAVDSSAESAMVLLNRARLRWITGMGDKTAGQAALDDLSRAKAMLPWDTPLLRSISNLERTIREVM